VRLSVAFNAGSAADPRGRQGTEAMMLAMLKEGTASRNSIQIAEEQERLGATVSVGASLDRTFVSLYALTPNFGPSLDLLADIILHPAFDGKELERVRAGQMARIAQEMTDPASLARRTFAPLLYGPDHPYAIGSSGSGDPSVVRSLTRDDLATFHHRWIRADTAEIFAVGDISLDQLRKELEARFAAWPMTRDMPGRKDFSVAPPARQARIVLVDRPQSPQSLILGGELVKGKGSDDQLDLLAANDILGGDFLSRINMDLRETKGWSYGVRSILGRNENSASFIVYAPVQADKTGASIAAIRDDIGHFLRDKGVTPEELQRTVNGNIRGLPGSYETSSAVLGQMQTDALFGRPFDYVDGLAARYRTQTAAALDSAARTAIDPATMTWVVVGDSKVVLPQLQQLGIPVTVVAPAQAAPASAKTGGQ
jgi:predicted Zn-dependent peptidase